MDNLCNRSRSVVFGFQLPYCRRTDSSSLGYSVDYSCFQPGKRETVLTYVRYNAVSLPGSVLRIWQHTESDARKAKIASAMDMIIDIIQGLNTKLSSSKPRS